MIQDQLRAGMTSGAEREAGVDPHCDAPWRRRFPSRPDPQPLADRDRSELRLAGAHPVLVVELFDREARRRYLHSRGSRGQESARIVVKIQDCAQALARPLARLQRNRLRAGVEQRIAERLGRRPVDFHGQREPGHHFFFFSSWASFCSR
jgi:hypothetical protein